MNDNVKDAPHEHQHPDPHTSHDEVRTRLARVVGHLQGVQRMIREKRSCPDVLQQLAAILGALREIRRIYLLDHLHHCIVEAAALGRSEAALDELDRLLARVL